MPQDGQTIRATALGVLVTALLAGTNAAASPAVERLFEQCARNLHRAPDEVSIRCRHYLDFAGDDDLARTRQVQAYLAKAERSSVAGKGWSPTPTPWRQRSADDAVLMPDLLRREGAYRVDVVRTYGSGWEGALLRQAEATYPVKRSSHCDAQGAAGDSTLAPPPDWACGAIGPLRRAGVASPAALQYYLDWTSAASDPAGPVHGAVRFGSSHLVYLAAINYRERFQVGKQDFQRVYVAEVNLGWTTMTPQGGKPAGFMLNKIVVFNGDGTVAALFDDHPINGAQPDG